jgi:hypothetical protein
MQSYHLTDEFADIEAEQALLASLMQSPALYWDLFDLLTPEVFSQETPTWQALALALETGQSPSISADWLPAPDPHTTAQRLVDLHQRRLLAAIQERLAQALFDETTLATDIVILLEEEALRVQAAMRNNTAWRLQWASTLLQGHSVFEFNTDESQCLCWLGCEPAASRRYIGFACPP